MDVYNPDIPGRYKVIYFILNEFGILICVFQKLPLKAFIKMLYLYKGSIKHTFEKIIG